MRPAWVRSLGTLAVMGMFWIAGCGGGGAAGEGAAPGQAGTASRLAWNPPTTFVDSTPLDPYTDLDHYEFYLREDDNFSDSDLHMAEVKAVENLSLVSEFDLNHLLPFVPTGPRCFLSIRAVGVDGSKSPFSQPVAWDHS